MREIRRGTLKSTANGPMYQHHDIWISPFAQEVIKDYANRFNTDENHVIGLIVDQYVGKNSSLDDRLNFLNKIAIPNTFKQRRSDENG